MTILIRKPGIQTIVQDLGRYGYRRFGINTGGPMDAAASRIANIVIGNDDNAALLEMHFPAPEILFETDAISAVCGADFAAELNDQRLDNWRPFLAAKGSVLRFTKKIFGSYAYLAVSGGLQIDNWLGSSSTNLTAAVGGYKGRKLAVGDRIQVVSNIRRRPTNLGTAVSASLRPRYAAFPTVRVVQGAEYESLTPSGQEMLVDHDFIISNHSDRMGFRLVGAPILCKRTGSFVSSAVTFGTIQALPDGQLIVLMADHQTTGGYPRVAHVISHDLPLIAQLGPNAKVAFHMIDHTHAEQLAVDFERELNLLRVGCRFQANSWN